MHEDIEMQLVNRATHGDVEAFERLIRTYEKTVYNLCLRMLGNEQEAYDAAQEVCVKIWRQLEHFRGESKLSTWIYRIATNQCLDRLRKLKHRQEISIFQKNGQDEEEWLIDQPTSKEYVEQTIETKAMQEIIKTAISELKGEHKTMIVLRDIQNYAYEEIADLLNLSLGTVKSRISRARLALKKILEQDKEPYKSFFVKRSDKEGGR